MKAKASDIMTESPACATPQQTAREVAALMVQHDTGVVPIVESHETRRLVGLVTDRDIAVRLVAEGRGPDTPVAEAMSGGIEAVGPDDPVKDVARLMADRQVRRVPVCGPDGRLLGIVSQADLAVDDAIADRQVGRVVEAVSQPTGRRPH